MTESIKCPSCGGQSKNFVNCDYCGGFIGVSKKEAFNPEGYMFDGLLHAFADNLKLQKFGPFDGFNFDITLVNEEGLSYKGLASGAVIKDELCLMFFLATELYFYDNYYDEFQNIISSMQKL